MMKKIIVIGSGIVGSSTAYHLAKTGAQVVIVDKLHEGQATTAGAGIVCPWISNVEDQDWYSLAREGACYYPSLIEQLEKDGEKELGYRMVGALAVSTDEEELNQIENKVRERRMETVEVGEITRLTTEEARRLFPPLRKDLAAVHVTGAARVDGQLLRNALIRAAMKNGGLQYNGVARLEVVGGAVTGVHVNNEYILADSIVMTAGAWAPELLSPFGIEIPVSPQKGQIAHLKLPGTDTSQWPVILPHQSDHYIICFDDSRVLVGATRETGSGFDYRVTAGGIKEVMEEALSVAPGLSDSTFHEMRIGFRPAGPSALPLLGVIPSIDNLVIATGLGASGLTMGPYIGKLAAKLSMKEKIKLDINPYNPLGRPVNV